MNDFRKYATQHLGMNGMVLDEVTSMQNQYLNPYIFRLGRPWERHFHLHQLARWKRNGRTWHLRYNAVYFQRRSYHLHRYGSFYGSRIACSGSGGQAFGIAA